MKNKLTNLLSLFFFTIVFSKVLIANEPFIQKVNYSEGLPSTTLYDLFTNKQGFLFIGSDIGLIRYNGLDFKLYPFEGNDGNAINAIQETKDGAIWAMNFSNQIFVLKGEKFCSNELINQTIKKSGPLKSFIIVKNKIWVLTENLVFTYENGKIEKIYNNKNNNTFLSIIYSELEKKIIVNDENFLYSFDISGQFNKKIIPSVGQREFTFYKGKLVSVLKNNIYDFVVNQELKKLDLEGVSNLTYVNRIIEINNNFWVCSNSGLIELDLKNKKLKSHLLKNIRISDIVSDGGKGLWVSSVEKGLFYIPNPAITKFQLSEFNISALTKGPNNTLFVGTGNGEIFQVDKEGKKIKTFRSKFFTEIEYLYYDSTKNRIISSHGVFNLFNNNSLAIRLGKHLTTDEFDNFIVCTFNRAFIFSQDFKSIPQLKGNNFKSANYNFTIPALELWSNRTKCASYNPKDKSYYFASVDALYCYDIQTTKFIKIQYKGKNVVATEIVKSDDNKLYVSTLQFGVLVIENRKVIRVISTNDGLSNNTCKKIIKDKNYLYVLTIDGIDRINLIDLKIQKMIVDFSTKGLNLTDICLFDNSIFIATNIGILKIEKQKNETLHLPKIVTIEAFNVKANQKIVNKNLSHNQNSISINADVIFYKGFGNFKYHYRLLGLEDKWLEQNSNNSSFNYFSLPPGAYTFEIKTSFEGSYSSVKSLTFTIDKPFWKTIWFYALEVLFFGFLMYSIIALITRDLRKKQILKERLLRSQLVALRSQMNPHFLFNVLNSIQGLIYENKKNEASNYLGKFSNLMRKTLENSDKQLISIHSEIELLKSYIDLESTRFENEFEFDFKINLNSKILEEKIPSMIIQPFVENAFKHGLLHKKGIKKLTIAFEQLSQKVIQIKISDNGVGRLESAKINAKRKAHKSFATQAIDSRINLVNKVLKVPISIEIHDLIDIDNNAIGTCVELIIPL